MKILYRYILNELIQPFLFGVFAFTGIFIGSDILRRIGNYMMDYGISIIQALQLLLLSLPPIIVYAFPMSMLLASLLCFGRLSGDSEIVAMKAGGISFFKIVTPVLIVSLLVSGATVLFNDTIVPLSVEVYEDMRHEIRYGEQRPSSQENLRIAPSSSGSLDFILTADKFDGDQTLEGVAWQDYESGRLVSIIQAERGIWSEQEWIFENGIIYNITEDGRIPRTEFSEFSMEDKITRNPRQISTRSKDVEEMSLAQLREHISLKEEEGENVDELLIDYHHRFAIPFASFIFAIVGASLGLQRSRSGSSIGLGFSILIVFIYYILMTVGSALGQSGTLVPWLGAWLQNFVFGVVGFALLFKAAK